MISYRVFFQFLLTLIAPLYAMSAQETPIKENFQKSNTNQVTLESYESAFQNYISKTIQVVQEENNFKHWIDTTLNLLSSNAHILEIGSAFGRDASYIESKGFVVQRTDATQAFVKLLQEKGYKAQQLNILTDPIHEKYDLIFANCVFLHFTRNELKHVLQKVYNSLDQNGILSFSVKRGEGEKWSYEKLGSPRYFCYWEEENIFLLLKSIGFKKTALFKDEKFLQIIVQKDK